MHPSQYKWQNSARGMSVYWQCLDGAAFKVLFIFSVRLEGWGWYHVCKFQGNSLYGQDKLFLGLEKCTT